MHDHKRQFAHGVASDGTVRDQATGYGLFRIDVPATWSVVATSLQQTGSTSQPLAAHIALRDEDGSVMRIQNGDAGMRNSATMQALMAMYGSGLAATDRTNYAEVPDPQQIADSFARQSASLDGAATLEFLGQLPIGDLSVLSASCMNWFTRLAEAQGLPPTFREPFAASLAHIYALEVGGAPWRAVSYVQMRAIKDDSGIAEALKSSFGFNMGSGFMGKLGLRNAPMQTPLTQARAQNPPAQPPDWATANPADYLRSGTVYWEVNLLASYLTPAEGFDEKLANTFLPLVASLEPHDDLIGLAFKALRQNASVIQQAANGAIVRNQQAFAAHQATRPRQAPDEDDALPPTS